MVRVAVLALALSGCTFGGPKVWVEESSSLSIEVGAARELRVATDNGSIRVVAAPAGARAITVDVTKRGGGADELDARRCLGAIAVRGAVVDDAVVLDWSWAEARHADWGAHVDFDLAQPAELALTVRTHNGPVSVDGAIDGCDAETHNGAVTVRGTAGPLRIRVHNGGIAARTTAPRVDVRTHNGDIELALDGAGPAQGAVETHNGAVSIELAEQVALALVCRTGNGAIETRGAITAATRGPDELTATIGAAEGTFEVETHNGAIVVRRP